MKTSGFAPVTLTVSVQDLVGLINACMLGVLHLGTHPRAIAELPADVRKRVAFHLTELAAHMTDYLPADAGPEVADAVGRFVSITPGKN